jgi:glutamyl-tRNA synthetase
VRTAIFNWLFARHEGGRFLLRVEDTDRQRSTPEALAALLDAMAWLGLDADEPPVFQSARLDAHRAAAEQLLARGAAYLEDKGGTGKGRCVVFRMPREDVSFRDDVRGELRKPAADMQDFVILRSDGTPVFHLSNVADDIAMGITHVIRGDDHIENTFRHVALYRALGAETPRFAHLPMIVNAHGKPYSKRDGDAYVGDFRARGFHPGALFNYLSLLGWSPGDDREKMGREDAARAFTLDRVKSGPAQMDLKKLTHLNAQYVAEMPLDDFAREAGRVAAGQEWGRGVDPEYFRRVCALMQTRTHLYSYAKDWGYFFTDGVAADEKAARRHLAKEGAREALEKALRRLEACEFRAGAIEAALREAEREGGMQEGGLNQPVRVAVTGLGTGAGLYETLELVGKPRAMSRLAGAIAGLRAAPAGSGA